MTHWTHKTGIHCAKYALTATLMVRKNDTKSNHSLEMGRPDDDDDKDGCGRQGGS